MSNQPPNPSPPAADSFSNDIVREAVAVVGFEPSIVEPSQNDPGVRATRLDFNRYAREDAAIDAANSASAKEGGNGSSTNQVVTASTKEKASRSRFNYSKEFLIAGPDLCLTEEAVEALKDKEKPSIIGQIVACPRPVTKHKYIVEWSNHGEDLPFEAKHLMCHFPSNPTIKQQLKDAVLKHKELGLSAPTKKRKKAAPKKAPNASTANPSNDGNNNSDKEETPPAQIMAGQAGAAFHTSSSISTMSAGSGTTIRTASTNRTSITARPNSDSQETKTNDNDDDSDASEIDSVLDEEDDAWRDFHWCQRNEEDSDTFHDDLDPTDNCQFGKMMSDLTWDFSIPADTSKVEDSFCLPDYAGPEAGLKRGVARQFNDPFECLSFVGGLDYEFVATLAANSNDYCRKYVLPRLKNADNKLHGCHFEPITTEHMYRFLGITLKISLSPVDAGGYRVYFENQDRQILGLRIANSAGFAQNSLPLWKHLQIRSAFHPVDKVAGLGGDKAYHLRPALNRFNEASLRAFEIGKDSVFDEGGVACRSRCCPIRQYNPNKPDKFRVDFFVLCCSRNYTIHHLDVCQGKNKFNVNIPKAIEGLPTTQKAVLNAVIQVGLKSNPHSGRHIAMDNRCMCPELAYCLRNTFRINSTGTCRKNRKGWPKHLLDVKKGDERGATKFAYDATNRILCAQWNDNKVVNVVSSIADASLTSVKRRVGSNRPDFPCPSVLRLYQTNMFGVDKADQMRLHGGGFSTKGHHKKWHKRSHFAMLDCMLLNSYLAWNMSAEDEFVRNRQVLKRHEFYTYIAERLLTYKDQSTCPTPEFIRNRRRRTSADDHIPTFPEASANKKMPSFRCSVCRMEARFAKSAGHDKPESGLVSGVGICSRCGVCAHSAVLPPERKRKIHEMEEFEGMTCFEIMHSEVGREIWPLKEGNNNIKTAPLGVELKYPRLPEPMPPFLL